MFPYELSYVPRLQAIKEVPGWVLGLAFDLLSRVRHVWASTSKSTTERKTVNFNDTVKNCDPSEYEYDPQEVQSYIGFRKTPPCKSNSHSIQSKTKKNQIFRWRATYDVHNSTTLVCTKLRRCLLEGTSWK